MFQYLILAIVIVVLISLIYWVFLHNDKSKRKKSEKYLGASVGTFDAGARRALDELTQIRNPEPDDYFRRGNIIQYNLLEGNLRNRGDLQERRAAVGHIVRDYTDAMVGMRGHIGRFGEDRDMNPNFMIDHMEDFNRNLLGIDDDDELAQMIFNFDNLVTTTAPVVRQEIIEDRRDKAINAANNRAEAIDKYFDAATKYTDDKQNVHDSKINSDLRETYKKFKATASHDFHVPRALDEINDYIHNEYTEDRDHTRKIRPATQILDIMSKGNKISTFNDGEDRILAYTWERCNHPRNRARSHLMRDAVIDALADSMGNDNKEVCINGRTARVLNSLVTLDYDDEVSQGAMTFEAYRNQIFQETKEIINQEIDRARNSPNEKLRHVGEAYEGADVDVDITIEEQFKNEIRTEIDRNIDSYSNKLTNADIENIKQECYVYATI